MGYSAPKILFPKDCFGKLVILRDTFVDCHTHFSEHQGDQTSSARSGHKSEDIMRMQLTRACAKACEFVV